MNLIIESLNFSYKNEKVLKDLDFNFDESETPSLDSLLLGLI